ncbi:hypothetical protein PC129_g15689 [Phytophthora cactorum]|uniref:Uncharacterized protein n=1 Tax=Phytophthora cactorum TaxID=29920 RepID=A0A329RD85_9STRA|nr:hypothetical protein Pcac1_g26562 [Phytophthora cactorum]KAG2796902.1 hypothetical protein PC111_g21520 [Phytophthora cactorum]KAG2807999.1 hypothetical protein PC112_g17163 [Phytophthora cactorum]KAG2850102.1 hypothetical protein PC113_g17088 [Phytophthora cactorum]KAG2903926.1 hypothetical protein PC114_g12041 [Phytophthora cactorum]
MEDDGIVAELKYEITAENEGIDVSARKFWLFLVNKNGHWLWGLTQKQWISMSTDMSKVLTT